jgi:hypothetical protein
MKGAGRKAEAEGLIREIQRYLAFVEALRGPAPPANGTDEKGK